jgi:hypothetical protein
MIYEWKDRSRLLVISCERPFIFYLFPAALAGTLLVGHGGEVRRYNGPDVDTIIAKSMRQAVAKFRVPKFVFLKFSRHHRRSWSGPGTFSCRISYFMSYYFFRVTKFVIFLSFSPSSVASALMVRTWDLVVSDIIFPFLIASLPFEDPNFQLSRLLFLSQTAKSRLGYAEKIVGKPFNMS